MRGFFETGWRRAALVLSVALSLGAGPPRAEADDDQARREARRLLTSGDRKLQRGDRFLKRDRKKEARAEFESALADYQAAFDAFPQPQIYYPIAQAELRLGRDLDALRQLLEGTELSDELRRRAQDSVEQLKARVAGFRFIVEPEGAIITIDGGEVGTAPMIEPYYVEPGEHTYSIAAEGHATVEGTAELAPGDILEETLALEPVAAEVTRIRKDRPDAPPDSPRPGADRRPLLVGVGLTAALAIGATITGLTASARHGTFSDETLPDDEREAARRSGRTLALTTDLLLVGATAAGVFSAYYYYRVVRPRDRALAAEEARSAMWLSPYVDGTGGGLAVGGRF
jgi:hypothetical protein